MNESAHAVETGPRPAAQAGGRRLVVQKYGGSSVSTVEKIKAIAAKVVAARRSGSDLVVVVSAMGHTTDQLLALARQAAADPQRRELDLLLSTGETASVALLTMAIRDLGEEAVGLTGGQCGIATNDVHTNARIVSIDTGRVRRELDRGAVVVVAGFQGAGPSGEVTTLGRGGSDTTATALAAALGADACQIFTDVDSVYSADPRRVAGARPLAELASDEMQEMAWHGAQVMKAEAVEFAKSNGVSFEIRSTFGDAPGTRILAGPGNPGPGKAGPGKGPVWMPRRPAVAGVTGRTDLVRLSLASAALLPGALEEFFRTIAGYDLVFGRLSDHGGSVDLLVSSQEIPNPEHLHRDLEQRFGVAVSIEEGLGAVSLIGFGLGSRPLALYDALCALAGAGFEVVDSFTGRESLSFLLDASEVEEGVRTLHRAFVEAPAEPAPAHDAPTRTVQPRTVPQRPDREKERAAMDLSVFETLESQVRSYSRDFPTVFTRALGSTLFDASGRSYVDFFSGAGALNYGHNNPRLKARLLAYLEGDGIIHSLDMATEAKGAFLATLKRVILEPRGLDYKIQTPGPTGTNAVEAALKLARKVTGRKPILYFKRGFHGMTLGALSVAGDAAKRARAGIPLEHTEELPFESDVPEGQDSLDHLEARLLQAGSELPAAVIVETIQAEGGVRVASFAWLARLEEILRRHGVLLIVDDIQVGCGRTGTFFSFEPAGLQPDLVCLSKSISGYGLPMSLLLIQPRWDAWQPGEHNGTFRGQNLSFVAATEALCYWEDDALARDVEAKARLVRRALEGWVEGHPRLAARAVGRGLIQGLAFGDPETAGRISRAAFERGLVIETAGPSGSVLKLLPPLTITLEDLEQGLAVIGRSLEELAPAAAARDAGLPEAVLSAAG